MRPKRNILVAAIALGFAAVVFIAFELHKTVRIIFGEQVHSVQFWGLTVADALNSSGMVLHEGDYISPAPDEPLGENQTVVLLPAYWVTLTADGITRAVWTFERKPNQILSQVSIGLNPNDLVLANGMVVAPSEPLPFGSAHSLQVKRATPVTVQFDGETRFISSNENTLAEALSNSGIQLLNADSITPNLETRLSGQEIQAKIETSAVITITTNDQEFSTRVVGSTVGEALTAAGIGLQNMDYTIPSEEELLPADGSIRIVRVREEIIFEQDPIPFSTQFQPAPQVDLDKQQVIQVGEFGIQARRIRAVYEDDLEVSRTVSEEWIAKEPRPRIIGYGTKTNIQTLDTSAGPIQYWRAVEAYATSYSPCRIGIPDRCSYYTASGAELKKGVIGVIRSWYNNMRGQAVYIPGYGFGTIEDIGAGFSDRHWVDLGYSDKDWQRWSGFVTVYFLTPVPANIMYALE